MPALLFSLVLSFISGRPITFRIHNDPFGEAENLCLLLSLIINIAISHSMQLFISEDSSVGCLAARHSDKAVRFNYGLNVDEYCTSEKTLDAIFMGTIVERKGVNYIAPVWGEVVRSIKTARFLLLGEGPDRNKLESVIKSHGLENNIELMGFVSEDQREILGRAKILFFP